MPENDYIFGRMLGRGSYGVVYVAERRSDSAAFVCKCIELRNLSPQAQEEAREEVCLLRRVSSGSEYIVQYADSFLVKDSLHIVMEYCEGGDLKAHIDGLKIAPSEEAVWKFLIQIGMGLSWLHCNRILHRDLKTMNVFLTASKDCRLGDLGVARVLNDEDGGFADTMIGTPSYMSPELCEGRRYNEKSDMWAFGCIAYELCTKRRPFEGKSLPQLTVKILRGVYKPISQVYSEELRGLVASCLQQSMDARPSINEVLCAETLRTRATRMGIPLAQLGVSAEATLSDPRKRGADKRVRRLGRQITQLYNEAVNGLDLDTRLIFDDLYRLFRAKVIGASKDSAAYTSDIEKHIFEELPVENTELIFKATKILSLEAECEKYQRVLLA